MSFLQIWQVVRDSVVEVKVVVVQGSLLVHVVVTKKILRLHGPIPDVQPVVVLVLRSVVLKNHAVGAVLKST